MPSVALSKDPFSDHSDARPPRPPPKSKMSVSANPYSRDIADAVRDTVHVRNNSPSDYSPRRVGRSQTAAYVVLRPQKRQSLMPVFLRSQPVSMQPSPKHPSMGRRSHSQDSGNPADKPKQSKSRAKKGSQHADVIDRLDFTGVGPST